MTKLYFLVGLLNTTAAISCAGVIFPTDGTATPGFFPSNGAVSASSVFHAFQFTVGAGTGGVLSQLVVAGQSSTTFTETFDILSDNSGNLGSLLATIPVPVIGDSVSRLYSASPATSLTLVAGTTYRIEAASPSGSDSFFWLQANPIGTATEFSSARSGTLPGQPSEAFPGCATSFRCSRTRHMAAFAFLVDPLGCQGRRSCRNGASARPSV